MLLRTFNQRLEVAKDATRSIPACLASLYDAMRRLPESEEVEAVQFAIDDLRDRIKTSQGRTETILRHIERRRAVVA